MNYIGFNVEFSNDFGLGRLRHTECNVEVDRDFGSIRIA